MSSAAIPEIDFADFLSGLSIAENRVPFEGTLETTFRCNLNCVHCYVNKPAGDPEEKRRELSTDRLKRLVDEIVAEGGFDVLFTGGEVLVRSDFEDVYLHALRSGLRVTIFTNATMITDRIADLFDANRPAQIEISLYGMTRETYERVTRVPGSFDKCLAGIERLRVRGIPFKIKTMVLAWNQHEVSAMRDFAHSLGTTFRHDSMLNPRVDCGANRNPELQVSAEQALAIDVGDERTRAKLERAFAAVGSAEPSGQVYECGAGQIGFTVDPYGELQLCQLSRKNSYDLKAGTFSSGWREFLPRARSREWQSQSLCRTCSLRSGCASCPGAAEMENGDPESIVRQFCEITHLRAHAVMGDESGHRRDATCCLGEGRLAAQPDAEKHLGGCGSCGHSSGAQEALIQIKKPSRLRAAGPA